MKFLLVPLCVVSLAVPAEALQLEPPALPPERADRMPDSTDSLWDGLWELLSKAVGALHPDLREAARVSVGILSAAVMVSVLQSFSSPVKTAAQAAGAVTVAATLLLSANSMIRLAADTVGEIGEYGTLLLPVMTAALAAQGGVTSSAALYAGTALFNSFLGSLLSQLLVPGIYLFLALSAGGCATGEAFLDKTAQLLKGFLSWMLKTLLMVFTTYLGLTGVVSGTTDAAALKAARVTMSSFIPVVGGILSDASEAVLVSAGLMKNAAGIYGILAVLALFLQPFLRIAVHYLMLKLTAAVCAMFTGQGMTGIIESFCTAMGLLLGMTGAACIMVLISTVCFMKGVG